MKCLLGHCYDLLADSPVGGRQLYASSELGHAEARVETTEQSLLGACWLNTGIFLFVSVVSEGMTAVDPEDSWSAGGNLFSGVAFRTLCVELQKRLIVLKKRFYCCI